MFSYKLHTEASTFFIIRIPSCGNNFSEVKYIYKKNVSLYEPD